MADGCDAHRTWWICAFCLSSIDIICLRLRQAGSARADTVGAVAAAVEVAAALAGAGLGAAVVPMQCRCRVLGTDICDSERMNETVVALSMQISEFS